jgi:hypothetical protein
MPLSALSLDADAARTTVSLIGEKAEALSVVCVRLPQ